MEISEHCKKQLGLGAGVGYISASESQRSTTSFILTIISQRTIFMSFCLTGKFMSAEIVFSVP